MSRKNNSKARKYRLIGNEYYQASSFFDALELYNKSLCHAIPSTEDFAMGFANRSAVYFELKEFVACKENIEMAITVGYPRRKLKTLQDRLERCQQQIELLKCNPQTETIKHFFKLSHPSNEKIPYIIDGIELRESDEYGRHLITTRKLNAGDIIAIEKPFFKYITNEARFTHCANCLKSEKLNLLPCKKCNFTMFCSVQCMSIGHQFHQFECDSRGVPANDSGCIFQMCHRVVFETLGLFGDIARLMMFVLENGEAKKTIFDIGDMSKMDEKDIDKNLLIVTHSLQRNQLGLELNLLLPVYTSLITTITDNPVLKEFLKDFMIYQLSLIITNSFEMSVDYEIFGAGVFPFASYFNHSCAPNVYRITHNGSLVFFVTRPIEKNQQLFVCYRENFHHIDRTTRQADLNLAYKFMCKCEACENDYEKLDKMPRCDKKLKISSSDSLPLDMIMDEYKRNCDYINANYQKYPCYELCRLIERNYDLLNYIECNSYCNSNRNERHRK